MSVSLWMQSEGLGVSKIGEYHDLASCTRRVRELDELLDRWIEPTNSCPGCNPFCGCGQCGECAGARMPLCEFHTESNDELLGFYQNATVFAIDERGRKFTEVGENKVTGCLIWEKDNDVP